MRPSFSRTTILAITLGVLVACASPGGQRGMDTFGRGLTALILSPVMIVAGLAQGLAFLPYTIATGLDALNQGLVKAQAVSLDASYRTTFGVSMRDARVDQQTGQVAGQNLGFGQNRPEAMLEATRAFQRLLQSQGMPEEKARRYVLVGDYSQVRSGGKILLAVTMRHSGMEPIRVNSKETGIVTTLRPEHQGWRVAYERDVDGKFIDEVIDWTGIDYAALRQDKVVAMLMVIAAESVKSGKRSPDYWRVEQRWNAGETERLIAESSARVDRALTAN